MRTTKGAPRFSYLPTKDNEVAVRQQLVQSTYGGGGNSEELFALAVNNQFSGLEGSGYDYDSDSSYCRVRFQRLVDTASPPSGFYKTQHI